MMKNWCTCTKCNTELRKKKYSDMSQIVPMFCFYKLCLSFSIMGWILFALNWYFFTVVFIKVKHYYIKICLVNWWDPEEKSVLQKFHYYYYYYYYYAIIISFMQGIYTYIPETNYVPRECSVEAIFLLLFMVLISLVSVLNLLYF